MENLLENVSKVLGLLPFHRTKANSNVLVDFVLMVLVPLAYIGCYCAVNFGDFGVFRNSICNSICHLSSTLFLHLGFFLYVTVYLLAIRRRKAFYIEFEQRLKEIDKLLRKCEKIAMTDKLKKLEPSRTVYHLTWLIVMGMFIYALYFDVKEMYFYYSELCFVENMVTTFPFLAGSVVQGQFIYHVSTISDRFGKTNELFEKINQECSKKNAPLKIYDFEGEMKPSENSKTKELEAKADEETDNAASDTDYEDDDDNGVRQATDGPSSENNLPSLFKLHDKILTLSVSTNSEYGPQCVPYMAACFIISIFGIFLETKVNFVVGGKNRLLDYITFIYVIWSLTTVLVAYLVLRLCCNANGYSKQSAMIVHEIMQKKPAFMLGNDLYYNKMKSFTLQFLHWESFFQFNGIGLFALDYTFIFSTVSAATSYLIVLLQFDMTAILKNDALL